MPVSYPEIQLRKLLEDGERLKLVLPNFQRDFVWTEDNQKFLIASLLLGIPIGNILLHPW